MAEEREVIDLWQLRPKNKKNKREPSKRVGF